MGVRRIGELLAALPPVAAEPAAAVTAALAEVQAVRHAALRPEELLALGEWCERLAAQAGAARLAVLAAITDRDDVVPRARVGEAGAVFAQHALGLSRAAARRDGTWAGLLRPEVGDLPAMGVAYAAGDISAGHVEVAVRTHRRLGAAIRDALVDARVDGGVPGDDADSAAASDELLDALGELSAGFTVLVRRILTVDTVLAFYARRVGVSELAALAERIVALLDPPSSAGAHERRFLEMSPLPDGRWRGRFECGPDQGLRLKRTVAAGSAPRPGVAVDTDGVKHEIPDPRDFGARQFDALMDIVNTGLAKAGITLPTSPDHPESAPESDAETQPEPEAGPGAEAESGPAFGAGPVQGDSSTQDHPTEDEPPPGEGEMVIVREPGVLVGAYPSVDFVLVAGIEHVATAWARSPGSLDIDPEAALQDWLRQRVGRRLPGRGDSLHPDHEPPDSAPSATAPPTPVPGRHSEAPPEPHSEAPPQAPPGDGRCACGQGKRGAGCDGDSGGGLSWLRRALSPFGVPARLEHAGPVDPDTLELLACNATIRTAVLAPNGALLDLGRAQRLATPAQKTALLARDGGCVIPGCTVPGDGCDAHHVIWWSRGGLTDVDNLVLVCGRHHDEIHQGTWDIHLDDGVPWVTPPRWIDPCRTPLRNAVHHPAARGGTQ